MFAANASLPITITHKPNIVLPAVQNILIANPAIPKSAFIVAHHTMLMEMGTVRHVTHQIPAVFNAVLKITVLDAYLRSMQVKGDALIVVLLTSIVIAA